MGSTGKRVRASCDWFNLYLKVSKLIGLELSGFTYTSSLTMNDKFQYRMRPNIFIIQKQIEYTAKENSTKLCNDSGVLNLHHDNNVKEVVSSQPSITWYKSANQKIGIPTVYES